MEPKHFEGVIGLQRLAFPAPFDELLLWREDHLRAHLDKLPTAQWVALDGDKVVGSCSNTQITQEHYDNHLSWDETVGGYSLDTFDPYGKVLYGLDISVHPDYRRMGMGRAFYTQRKIITQQMFDFYATACRIPDYQTSGCPDVETYCEEVKFGQRIDRTLSPLLRYGLSLVDVLTNYMNDPESGNAAALLEWRP